MDLRDGRRVGEGPALAGRTMERVAPLTVMVPSAMPRIPQIVSKIREGGAIPAVAFRQVAD